MTGGVWTVILLLGAGTYLLRLSFLALIGAGGVPPWASRLLRYVPVAILPALAAPAVVFPPGVAESWDPVRIVAGAVTLSVGALTRSVLGAIGCGMGALYLGQWLF